MPIVPYLFRHCGPSWEASNVRRPLDSIQKRTRVRTTRTVLRYVNSAAKFKRYHSYTIGYKNYFIECEKAWKDVVLGVAAPVKAPRAA